MHNEPQTMCQWGKTKIRQFPVTKRSFVNVGAIQSTEEAVKIISYRAESSTVCPCNMINIFIITNTMHTIGVE